MASSANAEGTPRGWHRREAEGYIVAFITVLAALLRIIALGGVPPGLYHDEAYNGLDALDVAAGHWPVYFAANNGREPLFIYLAAATVSLLGRSPGALRLAAALCGTFTIPATYLMARAWFDRRTGLLSAAILAMTLWHVHLSRVAFRAVTLPLASAVALWLGARALRLRRRRDWLLAGVAFGACFYTYLPAGFIPFILAAFGVYLLLRRQGRQLWPGAAWLAGGALLALIPLVAYAATHPGVFPGRTGQVSILNPLINGGDPWGMLGRQAAATLGMFLVRGDTIPRHNLPGRPVFDALLGAAAVLGTVLAALRARREAAPALTLIWVGGMLLPTILAEDAPHYLRAVGVLPTLVVLPALGLGAALTWLERRWRRGWALLLPGAVLSAGLAWTTWDYFVRYRSEAQVAFAFEDAAVELAAEANRFVGSGWGGHGLAARDDGSSPGRQAYVDGRLWDEWAAIPFLTSRAGGVARITPATPPSTADATLLLLWPYGGVEHYGRLLPEHVRIEAHTGPLARGDLEGAPYAAYVATVAERLVEPPARRLARFGGRIALVGCQVEPGGQEWLVRLEWQALAAPGEDYTVFVHLRSGERIVSQHDGQPAAGSYPTSLWRGGDVVVDTHVLPAPEEERGLVLAVGLYRWPAMEHLAAFSPSGESLGDELLLPATQ